MKIAAISLFTASIVVFLSNWGNASAAGCPKGKMLGFAVVTGDRLTGTAGVPPRFTRSDRYFQGRFNCSGRLISVRRLTYGSFEVVFPGNPAEAATATASLGNATTLKLGPGRFQVKISGPKISENTLLPTDSSFSIVVS